MDTFQLEQLQQDLSGRLIWPGDELYEQASHAYLHKGAPALVVQPATNATSRQPSVMLATTR
jgi:hypothetical protein